MRVIKIGGNELDNPAFVTSLANSLKQLQEPAVLVHGGGKIIDTLQQQLGITPVKANGLRVTDAASLPPTLMVLSGLVNKKLTAGLIQSGIDAIGLSGVDGGLLRCSKLKAAGIDLGFVGSIEEVRVEILENLTGGGLLPVISPMSLGYDGQIMNVNADQAAAAIAAALNADMLDFISNVSGVVAQGQLLPTLSRSRAEALIQDGTIHSGMLPKIQAAFDALEVGVSRVRIVDLDGFAHHAGTILTYATQPIQAQFKAEVLQ
ncbi:MAG: acetylglutamate kinase [Anaerolineales bacterium]|nr:acetylglutamate kinase [Anaerolineales bacterium]